MPTLAELLEPAVLGPASTAVTASHLGAAEKCAAVSIAISLKRIADTLESIHVTLRHPGDPVRASNAEIIRQMNQLHEAEVRAKAAEPPNGPGPTP